jgi:ADP-ribose pyrophosphatase YjhB (NUDIX family)
MNMLEMPLPIVVTVLTNDDKILLIKRAKGNYKGLWGLPGGKIERDEHLSEAAVRELFEETGVSAVFEHHLGFVSEHLVEAGKIIQHFLLHICELQPLDKDPPIQFGREGPVCWFTLSKIEEAKENIIPSDFLIIEKMVKGKGSSYCNYYNCLVERYGKQHFLKRFS